MDLSLPNDFESAFLNEWGDFGEGTVSGCSDTNNNNSAGNTSSQQENFQYSSMSEGNKCSSTKSNTSLRGSEISIGNGNSSHKGQFSTTPFIPSMMDTGDNSLSNFWQNNGNDNHALSNSIFHGAPHFSTEIPNLDVASSSLRNTHTDSACHSNQSSASNMASESKEKGRVSQLPTANHGSSKENTEGDSVRHILNNAPAVAKSSSLHQSSYPNTSVSIEANCASNSSEISSMNISYQLPQQHSIQQHQHPDTQPAQNNFISGGVHANVAKEQRIQQEHRNELYKNASLAMMQRIQPRSHPGVSVMTTNTNQTVTEQQNKTELAVPETSNTIISTSSANGSQLSSVENPPPFFLFGAPAELRNNFIQTQREQKLPILQDNNSFHYGMAVNGFHPQINAMENPPVLLDGRHHYMNSSKQKKDASTSGCKERNEKEQRRAQKITELIESLRLSMVKGGWKVEMKSKYHTLSTCAEYVQHLIDATKEKEEAVERVKSDLQERNQNREVEKAMVLRDHLNQDMSVTSSLTSSTISTNHSSKEVNKNSEHATANVTSVVHTERKRKAMSQTEGNGSERSTNDDMRQKNVCRISMKGSPVINSSNGVVMKSISIDKVRCSSVSDVADSNQSSEQGFSSSAQPEQDRENHTKNQKAQHAEEKISPLKQESVCSTAAVMSFRKNRGIAEAPITIDYKEVFMTSNVPQIIATTAGKITSWNSFFLKATGLSPREIRSMTIFSMVRADRLSSLFENIASILRKAGSISTEKSADEDHEPSTKNGEEPGEKVENKDNEERAISNTEENENKLVQNKTSKQITRISCPILCLPCVPFPIKLCMLKDSSSTYASDDISVDKLFMAVSLLNPEDHRGRFLHCTFSNAPGKDKGSIGYITADLLARLTDQSGSKASRVTKALRKK